MGSHHLNWLFYLEMNQFKVLIYATGFADFIDSEVNKTEKQSYFEVQKPTV